VNGRRIGALLKPLHKREHVAKFIINVVSTMRMHVPGFSNKIVLVNEMPALASYIHGNPLNLVILEVRNGLIANIYVQSNKEKLKKLV